MDIVIGIVEVLVGTGIGGIGGRLVRHLRNGERNILRKKGMWECNERCGYSFLYCGYGNWVGPFCKDGHPYTRALSSAEIQDEYADCWVGIKYKKR